LAEKLKLQAGAIRVRLFFMTESVATLHIGGMRQKHLVWALMFRLL
jgi:hypothetical protein